MASSRIRINEANEAELQRIKSIGPKRAAYIYKFRQEIGPINNTFDLATAAGMSIKAVNRISGDINWYADLSSSRVSFWPLVITSIASFWLFGLAYHQLLSMPKDLAEFCFSASISLILSGALVATADIALTSFRKDVNETTYLFSVGITLCAAGLLSMTGLTALGLVTNLPPDLTLSLKRSMLFVSMVLIIFWVMYGPAIALRWNAGRSNLLLNCYRHGYEWSHPPIAFITAYILIKDQHAGSLEEIFAIWAIVVLAINGLEMIKGQSPFKATLSNRDLERYEFLLRHQLTSKPTTNARLIGTICLASTAMLAGLLLVSVIQL